ncbi:MAG TPA: lysophospholipid acyltransferase family protein [Elusimicrobiales bacterium]|nr:lysophospholipid acyltransferase family protein [Elusimicrobiales bacterium]
MNELHYEGSLPHAILPRLARLYVWMLALTSRINVKGEAFYAKPAIYAIWHRQEVLMIYLQRNRGLAGLVSLSKDGEYMARILRLFGFALIRGSTTTGGSSSLRALIRAGRAGTSLAITPDGPKGPVFKVQPGAVYIAQKTGLPVLPCAAAFSKKIVLRNWDKYQFPLPFGRMQAVYGPPFFVAEGDDIAAKAAELEGVLNSLTEEAERLLAA